MRELLLARQGALEDDDPLGCAEELGFAVDTFEHDRLGSAVLKAVLEG